MTAEDSTRYRLRLAREYLARAERLMTSGDFAAVGLNAQVATENMAKAVLHFYGRPNKTHEPAKQLWELVNAATDEDARKRLARLAQLAEQMGLVEHILATYGDEVARKTPEDIYDRQKAINALAIAEEAHRLAETLTTR